MKNKDKNEVQKVTVRRRPKPTDRFKVYFVNFGARRKRTVNVRV